jgi:hypothetical protein
LREELYGIEGIAGVFIFLEEGFDSFAMRWHKAPFEWTWWRTARTFTKNAALELYHNLGVNASNCRA